MTKNDDKVNDGTRRTEFEWTHTTEQVDPEESAKEKLKATMRSQKRRSSSSRGEMMKRKNKANCRHKSKEEHSQQQAEKIKGADPTAGEIIEHRKPQAGMLPPTPVSEGGGGLGLGSSNPSSPLPTHKLVWGFAPSLFVWLWRPFLFFGCGALFFFLFVAPFFFFLVVAPFLFFCCGALLFFFFGCGALSFFLLWRPFLFWLWRPFFFE